MGETPKETRENSEPTNSQLLKYARRAMDIAYTVGVIKRTLYPTKPVEPYENELRSYVKAKFGDGKILTERLDKLTTKAQKLHAKLASEHPNSEKYPIEGHVGWVLDHQGKNGRDDPNGPGAATALAQTVGDDLAMAIVDYERLADSYRELKLELEARDTERNAGKEVGGAMNKLKRFEKK